MKPHLNPVVSITASFTIAILLFLCACANGCFGQYAKYERSRGIIEIDLGTSKLRLKEVLRIYLQRTDANESVVYQPNQILEAGGTGLKSYTLTMKAPNGMPQDLSEHPVQLDILVKPKADTPDVAVISISIAETSVQVPYAKMLDQLNTELISAEGGEDAELYASGNVTTAVGSKPNWVVDLKYEREMAKNNFPLVFAPFFNLKYNSEVKNDTDKLSFGIRFSKGFHFASSTLEADRPLYRLLENNTDQKNSPKYNLFKRSQENRNYFLYEGSAEFESDWDFRVNNLITSQDLSYLVRPKFFRNRDREVNGKITFTPVLGTELGVNLKNPILSGQRGIARVKAGATLTITADKPLGGILAKEFVWENTFTQRWFLADEFAFDKDDDGNLLKKDFGRRPRSHFSSSFELKFNDYVGTAITYEWGEEPPLYNLVKHKVKFGLVYSFKRKPLP